MMVSEVQLIQSTFFIQSILELLVDCFTAKNEIPKNTKSKLDHQEGEPLQQVVEHA